MFASLRARTALTLCLSLGLPSIAGAATVALAWNANPETNIAGYVIVYGTTPGSYSGSVDVGKVTTYTVTSLAPATRYYFALRAYNTSAVSGPLSSEVSQLTTGTAVAVQLVAAYGFGEASGTLALDATANNNDGTLAAGVTRTAAGRFGRALVFNGTNALVTIPSTASLDLTSAFTMAAWISPSVAGGWRTILMKESAGGHTYVLYSDPGTGGAAAHVQTTSDRIATSPTALTLNAWTHVAAVSDGTTMRLLVNGQQAATVSVLAAVQSSTSPLRLGGNLVWGEYFAGTIDEVRIYKGALTNAQVQQDMTTPVETTAADTTLPTVALTSPTGGTVAGSVPVTATAADNVGVAGVRFKVDGADIGSEDLTSPYSVTWNSSTVTNGTHALTAVARDAAGNARTSAAVTVTVSNTTSDTTKPTVSITSPAAGASVAASATLTANAADNVAVAGVQFKVDGANIGTEDLSAPYSVVWNSTSVANGTRVLTAFARDAAGNWHTSAGVSVVVSNDSATPTVVSVSPGNGASNVPRGTAVTAVFSEPMDPSSVSSSTFELRTAAGVLLGAAVTYDSAARTARLIPSVLLSAGATFTATIKGGTGGVRDLAGNAATSTTTWSFSVSAQTSTGPVAVYGFDEGVGSILNDLSGNQLHGTVLGATWQSGRFGKSLQFDGVNDSASIPANTLLDASAAVTIEAWVYPTAFAGWNTVVFKEASGAHTYALYAAGDGLGAGGHMQLAADQKAHQTATLPLGQWSHLATTYDGQTVRLFVNAVQVASVAASGPVAVSNGALRIGGNNVWGEYFTGRIDEVRLYRRALGAAEIAADMGTPASGWLAAAYGFNESAGSTAADSSGRQLTGAVSGATWTTGRFGNGLAFNGVNSMVSVPHDTWLNLTTGMTLEAWVYPTDGGGWRTVLLKEAAGGHTFALYSDGHAAPAAHLQATTDVVSEGLAPLPLQTWTHLAVTYTAGSLRLYVNGALTTTTAVTGSPVTSALPLRIGGNAIWGEYFAGIIDEVRIYYRALTAAEITADMDIPVR
jgi:hydrogenase maturation factor HypE